MNASGKSQRKIAEALGRVPSTISLELVRNRYPTDGSYKALHAGSMARGSRRRARQGSRLKEIHWLEVESLSKQDYSPEHVSARLKLEGGFAISHETIYKHVRADKQAGGTSRDRTSSDAQAAATTTPDAAWPGSGTSRSAPTPPRADPKSVTGRSTPCMEAAEAASQPSWIGRPATCSSVSLKTRPRQWTKDRLRKLMSKHPASVETITVDNGCEFRGYREIVVHTGVEFYFAKPYASWEHGTNKNTNGLIWQYLHKGCSMDDLIQARRNAIARKLNDIPRKHHGFRTPAELFENSIDVALQS